MSLISSDLLILALLGYLLGLVSALAQQKTTSRQLVKAGLMVAISSTLVASVATGVWAVLVAGWQLVGVAVTTPSWVRLLLSLVSLAGGVGCYLKQQQASCHGKLLEQVTLSGLQLTTLLVAALLLVLFATLLEDVVSFFSYVAPLDFFFGLDWNMQAVSSASPAEVGDYFGVVPLLLGTLVISSLAVLTALPLSIPAAIYLAEYAGPRAKRVMELAVRILAGIPTIVYGFFALSFFGPALLQVGASLGITVAAESALIAGLVTGLMIVPITTSLLYETMAAVPDDLREGSLSLGATKAETIIRVVLPASKDGILIGLLLALSRAIGETMIVVMAAGVQAELSVNPLKAMTTVTVQIVRALSADAQFDSPKTLAAFVLGALLLIITVSLNSISVFINRRKRLSKND